MRGPKGDKEGRREGGEKIRASFESGDWDDYKVAVEGTEKEDKITKSQFDVLVEARQLRENGDHEAARELVKNLDMEREHDRPEISEEDRETLKEARDLRESGDKEGAKELMDGLREENPDGFFKKAGKKFMGLFKK
jgi:hypothetical protein